MLATVMLVMAWHALQLALITSFVRVPAIMRSGTEPAVLTNRSRAPSLALNGSLDSNVAGAWHSLQVRLAWVDSLCVTASGAMT